jgi:hypothetical protein
MRVRLENLTCEALLYVNTNIFPYELLAFISEKSPGKAAYGFMHGRDPE